MHRRHFLLLTAVLLLSGLIGCGGSTPYVESFDDPGTWRVASDANVSGQVENGVYDFEVFAVQQTFWTTADETFDDGIYEVEATQVAGPDDNAYGMIFRVDTENNNFYTFQISGDGFVWIGRYLDGGQAEAVPIVGDWWFESDAVKQGSGVTNKLTVRAEGANLIFFVNDQEVGRVTDDAFRSGDIGLIVRTLGVGGVHIQFDNFAVRPLESTDS